MRLREVGSPDDRDLVQATLRQARPFASSENIRALGNYVPSSLAHRYDAFLFFDQTNALNPLRQGFDRAAIPETWPQGM